MKEFVKPNRHRGKVSEEMEKKIMAHFWNEHDNRDATISKKFGIIQVQVSNVIANNLDEHFNRINQRINK